MNPEAVGLSTDRLARIDTAVNKYITPDKIAGTVTLLARRGEIVQHNAYGLADRENDRTMTTDTIFRIYSMTKPITCAALMLLYEQGHFQLADPVFKYIPAFADLKVYVSGKGDEMKTEALKTPVTIRHLLTHTAGLTYHFLEYGRVEEMFREAEFGLGKNVSLEQFVDGILQVPLAFQPGTRWRYSFAHDVVARLVEIISGQNFAQFLQENIFEPLEMEDTGFYVPEEKLERFAAMYGSVNVEQNTTTATTWFGMAMMGANNLLASPHDSLESKPHRAFRGGTGLVSTASDYWRFCQMLLNNGQFNGRRLLGRKTIELMTANHLAPELLPYELANIPSPGFGYGLGVTMMTDLGLSQIIGSEGAYGWSGAANTNFWIDPQEEMIGILMAQFQPSGYHLISQDFRVAAYQAIID